MASKLAIVTEIPRIENTRPLMNEAFELLFVEVGQKVLGRSPHDLYAKKSYIEEVNDCRLFLALSNKAKVIGAATLDLELPGDGFILQSLAVSPKHRNRQIGSKLIELVENVVESQGFNRITVVPGENSVSFYKSHGYKLSERYLYDNPMVKKLKPKDL